MKPEIIFLIVAVAIVIFIFAFPFPKKIATVEIAGAKIKAEIADNPLTQTKGLMFHKPLAENEGMLFIFGREDIYSFWMMNVSFPIDIIWLSSEKKIVYVVENARPCFLDCKLYATDKKAKYVLEVKDGFVKKHKLTAGDKLVFAVPIT